MAAHLAARNALCPTRTPLASRTADAKAPAALRARKAASPACVAIARPSQAFSARNQRWELAATPDYYADLFENEDEEVVVPEEVDMWAEFERSKEMTAEELEAQEELEEEMEFDVPSEEDNEFQLPEEFGEKLLQIRRVTKVVKGGKQLSFRAVVVVGDENGTVGVGCGSAEEVMGAMQAATKDAMEHLVYVKLSTRSRTFQHRVETRHAAAKVMLRPAADGTGLIAGGAVRVVLEFAGVSNGFGKQLGSDNLLNNARATLKALGEIQDIREVAIKRQCTPEELYA